MNRRTVAQGVALSILAAVFAAPTFARAAAGDLAKLEGTVKVYRAACSFDTPNCPFTVKIAAGETEHLVEGALKADLAAFEGKAVTVRGRYTENGVLVKGFRPGKDRPFFIGTVVVEGEVTQDRKPQVGLKINDRVYEVVDRDLAYRLAGLDGAVVTLTGEAVMTADGKARFEGKYDQLLVRGTWTKSDMALDSPFAQEMPSAALLLDNGRKLNLTGKKRNDLMGKVVWVSGGLVASPNQGEQFVRAQDVSAPVFQLDSVTTDAGSNLSRGASTAGGTTTSQSGGTGAGVNR